MKNLAQGQRHHDLQANVCSTKEHSGRPGSGARSLLSPKSQRSHALSMDARIRFSGFGSQMNLPYIIPDTG